MTIIVVTNRSGGSGKSTLAKFLVKPYLGPDTPCIAFGHEHSAKPEGYADFSFSPSYEADEVASKIILSSVSKENLVVDIGSSEMTEVNNFWEEFHSLHQRVDVFLLPCMPNEKQVADTISTITDLLNHGVDVTRIAVLRNKPSGDSHRDKSVYLDLDEDAEERGYRILKTPVMDSKIFDRTWAMPEMLGFVTIQTPPPTENPSPNELALLSMAANVNRGADDLMSNLDQVFAEMRAAMATSHMKFSSAGKPPIGPAAEG